jgi:hypothetical protein
MTPKHAKKPEPEDAPTSWWGRHAGWLGPRGAQRQERILAIVGAAITIGVIAILVIFNLGNGQ